jgi:unsaturated chondroitin disaccharide hydrolase
MKRFLFSIAIVAALAAAFKSDNTAKVFLQENFSFADKQLKNMLAETASTPLGFPRSADSSGKLITTDMYEWTSGFFPGSLWYAYEYTKDPQLKTAATEWTERLEPLKTFTQHHDLGFMLYCSYGNAYRLTGNEQYKNILIEGAKSLSTRFSPVTGSIKSWNKFHSWSGSSTVYNFPVIVDNMMNLEMLFFASKMTGDSTYRHIAYTHALTAMKNHVRKDYSSYHVVCYDTATGKVVLQETAQGYADNSTWARGQAWGVYGFTLCYRETKDERFLKTAQGMADWYINNKNLPADKIPYWDFNVGQQGYTPGSKSWAKDHPLKLRDASAAAIVSSALLELSTYSDAAHATKYKAAALQMLQSLGSPAYRAPLGKNANFIIEHSVGALTYASELDVPLVYADYYFLEGLNRYNRLLNGNKVVPE